MSTDVPSPSDRWPARRLALAILGSGWLVAGGLWLREILGSPAPTALARGVVLAAAAATAAWIGLWAWESWRLPEKRRAGGGWLLALTILSLGVHLAGIQFELLDHPRSDEGVYYEEAVSINRGDPLPSTFNYGHLYYYLPAFVLWIQGLFATPFQALAAALYGLESSFATSRLLLRALTALLAALTTIPVFWAAHRIAGRSAAILAGFLVTFSTLYNTVAHEVICDVPAGFFATLCFALTARLLERETRRGYLLAGIAAGLAAASKYPGGVSALAIFGLWLSWRLRSRRWSWHLLESAAAAIATMMLTMPALWLRSQTVATGHGRDIFFGWRQYALSGWTGVMPESVPGYYAQRLLADLGWPAALLGLSGLFLLRDRSRRRLAAMALFPVGYLVLIGAMNMAVIRNLQPVLPALTVVLGVGCAGWLRRMDRLPVGPRSRAAVLGLLVLAGPAYRTLAWDVSRSRPGTRQQMHDWIEENVPHGAGIVREDYTPELEPRHYLSHHRRFLWRVPPNFLAARHWDFVMVADAAHGRFFPDPPPAAGDHRLLVAQRYREIFQWPVAARFSPSRFRTGPQVTLYRIPAPEATYRQRRRWTATQASWVSDESIRPATEDGPLLFNRRWQTAVFKDFFEPGRYQILLRGEPATPEAYVHVVTPENLEVGSFVAGDLVVDLPRREKYLVRVFQEPGSSLAEVIVRQAPEEASPSTPLPPS